ncbi:MutS-related protein [Candidatus Deianiraea vastatrix]|uniref:DNA mismatch repair protein MutS n=1 Tax=Candidatus Deianiraea vastatrix TaxID=2163644 RepID=A0A5B8XFX4_9RICK|nr:MutS family DNA mismatch repair protein [Candidatus Deianiraea vastatrix]QED23785.1 DNA mismatch repair protein MutS [Candidatus Deianiraea vastatrix]
MSEKELDIISQYNEVKRANMDKIVLFKIGAFYEIIGNDAIKIAPILNLKETSKKYRGQMFPMCGFPVGAQSEYVRRLLENGFSIVIVNEKEISGKVKQKRERFVSDIVTPSISHLQEEFSYSQNSSYIASIGMLNKNAAILFIDISVGESFIEYCLPNRDSLMKKLFLYEAKEVLIKDDFPVNIDIFGINVIRISNSMICENDCIQNINGVQNLTHSEKMLFWQVLCYIENINPDVKFSINSIEKRYNHNQIYIPTSTILNLNIASDKIRNNNTLFYLLNKTLTPMGARMLKSILTQPKQININERLDIIEYLIRKEDLMNDIAQNLRNIYDFDRLIFRLINKTPNKNDFIKFIQSIYHSVELINVLLLERLFISEINIASSYGKQIFQEISSIIPYSDNIEFQDYDIPLDKIKAISDIIRDNIVLIKKISNFIGVIDTLYSLSFCSKENNWVRPQIIENDEIYIKNGYHPIYKSLFSDTKVVENDYISDKKNRTFIITGTNMSGKSLYLKQVGLICFMSQIGCYVPCSEMKIGKLSAIISRIGGFDAMEDGKSTFYVELEEIADMIYHADDNSLCLIDELGRGASFEDGLEISTKVLVHLHKYAKTRVLCSSHIYQITELEGKISGITNYHFKANINIHGTLEFTYLLEKGTAKQSILKEIARIAGIPEFFWNQDNIADNEDMKS